MDVSQELYSFNCIKPNAVIIVKRLRFCHKTLGKRHGVFLLLLSCLFFFYTPITAAAHRKTSALAEETPVDQSVEQSPSSNQQNESSPESNPAEDTAAEPPQTIKKSKKAEPEDGEIEATTYPIEVVRRSNSNRVYLFDDKTDRQPKTGRILLLKKEDEPYMAFRVLRNYPEKRMFAAKRIKKYKDHRILDDGDTFTTIEKVGDFHMMPTLEDNADLNEIETRLGLKISAYDPELDKGSSPPPADQEAEEEKNSDIEQQEQDAQQALTVEEAHSIDHFSHWLSGGFGYVKNNAPPAAAGSYNFSSGNLRYGYSLGKQLLLDYPHLQDSLVIEGGVYVYKAINFAVQGDAYTVLALSGNVRYNFIFSEKFGLFAYAGFMKHTVQSNVLGQADAIGKLNSSQPVLGAGLLLQLGPSWYARVDLGIDSMTINLLLHF